MTQSNTSYILLDSGNLKKLETFGPFTLIRPSLQALWKPNLTLDVWKRADAEFVRDASGKGRWNIKNSKMPREWVLKLKDISLSINLTDFGHLGIFPEHFQESKLLEEGVKSSSSFKCLNLFAYTGALTLSLASSGAEVVHVDASKKSVEWARKNAELSNLNEASIRWIVEDVRKFVARELRRRSKYDAIILDPPTFGRGSKNEVWKIEEDLPPLLSDLSQLLSENFKFIFLSCHTPGLTPLSLKNLLEEGFSGNFNYKVQSGELCLRERSSLRPLPSGSYCLLSRKNEGAS